MDTRTNFSLVELWPSLDQKSVPQNVRADKSDNQISCQSVNVEVFKYARTDAHTHKHPQYSILIDISP